MTTHREIGLSDRQLETVELFARGMSLEEIGEKMGITPRTVKQHLDVARLKLGVQHRRQVPYALFERGINVYPK